MPGLGFIGFPELLILGGILLVVFGPKRLPELGRSLGGGLREFKDSVTGLHKNELAALPAAEAIMEPLEARSEREHVER